MPEFLGLQCFKCEAFQVQQKKKTNKWKCAICQSKQTVRKIYAVSAKAKEVRGVVMDLNMRRGEAEVSDFNNLGQEEPVPEPASSSNSSLFTFNDHSRINTETSFSMKSDEQNRTSSKWNRFLPNEENHDNSIFNQPESDSTAIFVTDISEMKKSKKGKAKLSARKRKREPIKSRAENSERTVDTNAIFKKNSFSISPQPHETKMNLTPKPATRTPFPTPDTVENNGNRFDSILGKRKREVQQLPTKSNGGSKWSKFLD